MANDPMTSPTARSSPPSGPFVNRGVAGRNIPLATKNPSTEAEIPRKAGVISRSSRPGPPPLLTRAGSRAAGRQR